MKRAAGLAVLFFVAFPAMAQEFWILTSKFKYPAGGEVSAVFLTGHNFDGDAWDLKRNKIEKLELHTRDAVADLRPDVRAAEKVKLKTKLTSAGTQLIVLQSAYAVQSSDAQAFSAFLKEEGQDQVLRERVKAGSDKLPAKERVARFAKVLILAGDTPDDAYKKKTGLRLEIIPLQNPQKLHPGDYLECQVTYEGKILPHQLVKVFNVVGHSSFLQDIYTEDNGTIKFPISAPGRWLVSTVRVIRSETADAQWQTMWSSLVFGI